MPDKVHEMIDRKLERMEKRLSGIYSGLKKEIEKMSLDFLESFKKADEKQKERLESGEITKGEYARWRRGKILYSERFKGLQKDIAARIEKTNEIAMAYVNGQVPEVYALSYNALERKVDGVGGYSFTIVNENTLKTLAATDKSLLPRKKLDPKKDKKWNMGNVNRSVLVSIHLGESIPDMAKRLRQVETMNRVQSVRAARTLVTAAENKGRQDSYEKAVEDGIILEKIWISTHDSRTRDAHREAGARYTESRSIPIDEPFIVGGEKLMYPGDTSLGASGHNIYNCRCTSATVVKGFKKNGS